MSSFTTLVSIDASAATKLASFISTKFSTNDGESFVAKVDELVSKKAPNAVIDLFLTKIDIFLGLPTEQGSCILGCSKNKIYNKYKLKFF